MSDRSEFYRRMTEYDAATARAWVARFLRALDALSGPPAPRPEPLLTADEVRRLDALRWRVEHGLVPS